MKSEDQNLDTPGFWSRFEKDFLVLDSGPAIRRRELTAFVPERVLGELTDKCFTYRTAKNFEAEEKWKAPGHCPYWERDFAAFLRGECSLVILDHHVLNPTTSRLSLEISRQLGFPVRANLYLTPPETQTLPAHWDDHDVIIYHMHGQKFWSLYEPLPSLPPYGNAGPLRPGKSPNAHYYARTGSRFYVPRGLPHFALTEKTFSVHITFGLFPARIGDVIKSAIKLRADRVETETKELHTYTARARARIKPVKTRVTSALRALSARPIESRELELARKWAHPPIESWLHVRGDIADGPFSVNAHLFDVSLKPCGTSVVVTGCQRRTEVSKKHLDTILAAMKDGYIRSAGKTNNVRATGLAASIIRLVRAGFLVPIQF